MKITDIQGNTITIEFVDCEIKKEDIGLIEEEIEKLKEHYQKVNLILLISHDKISAKALLATLRTAFHERKHIHKIAVIGNKGLALNVLSKIDNLIVPWKEKYFSIDNLKLAWDWLKV